MVCSINLLIIINDYVIEKKNNEHFVMPCMGFTSYYDFVHIYISLIVLVINIINLKTTTAGHCHIPHTIGFAQSPIHHLLNRIFTISITVLCIFVFAILNPLR